MARLVTAVLPQIMRMIVMRIKQVPGTLGALRVVPHLVFITVPHGVGLTAVCRPQREETEA